MGKKITEKELCSYLRAKLLKPHLDRLGKLQKGYRNLIGEWGKEINNPASDGYYYLMDINTSINIVNREINRIRALTCEEIFYEAEDEKNVPEHIREFLILRRENKRKKAAQGQPTSGSQAKPSDHTSTIPQSQTGHSPSSGGISSFTGVAFNEDGSIDANSTTQNKKDSSPLSQKKDEKTRVEKEDDSIMDWLEFSEEGEVVDEKEAPEEDKVDYQNLEYFNFSEDGAIMTEDLDKDLETDGEDSVYTGPDIETWDIVGELKKNKKDLDIAKKMVNFYFDVLDSKSSKKILETANDKFLAGKVKKWIKYGKVVNNAFDIFSGIVTEQKYGTESISKAKIAAKKLAIATAEIAAGESFGNAKNFTEFVGVILKETIRAVDGDEAVKDMPDDIYGLYDAFRKMHPESGITHTPSSWTEVVP